MKRKFRLGMIGGGVGAFIGPIHRMVSNLDGKFELVCGAFSNIESECTETGEALFLDPKRVYLSFDDMIKKEKELPADVRMDAVSVVTPNFLHFQPSFMALDNGFPVICEKPLCLNLDEAFKLRDKINEKKIPFALTHTYTGYPMVKEAKQIIKSGKLGEIRKVMVEYPQGWLSEPLEFEKNRQASWRTDPKMSGKSGCYGDIGTHAANLVEYVTNIKISKVLSQLSIIVKNRMLDDDASVLFEMENGAKGVLMATQIAAGAENNLKVRVYGDKGGLEWQQEDNNSLIIRWKDKPREILRAGVNNAYLSEHSRANSRTPAGHPEGYLEAFANIYRNFSFELDNYFNKNSYNKNIYDFPGIEDGVRGMQLVEAMVESTQKGNVWIKV